MSNLDKTFDCDLGNVSFREYFRQLLRTLITKEEGFSGKRPFGNSGWLWELGSGLAKHAIIPGDEDDQKMIDIEAALLQMVDEMAGEAPRSSAT